MSDILMAVDPGVTTGVAVEFPLGGPNNQPRIVTHNIGDVTELFALIRDSKPARIAVETFVGSAKLDSNKTHTIELVGAVRALCWAYGIPCHGQTPGSKRAYLPDANAALRAWGTSQHEKDAYAHLLLLKDRIKKGKL